MMGGKISIDSRVLLPLLLVLFYILLLVGGTDWATCFVLSSDVDVWWQAPWSLVSYSLVHTAWLHMGVNTLLMGWLSLSKCIEAREFWLLFLSGVLIGGIIFVAGGDGILLGASSGIAAIVPVEVFRRIGKKWGIILFVLWVLLFEFYMRSTFGSVVQTIHLGGYLIGLVYLLFSWHRIPNKVRKHEGDLIEKVKLSGYQSLNKSEREQIKNMGV